MDKFERCPEKFKKDYAKREQLCALMDDWKDAIYKKDTKNCQRYFTADGFFPNYFTQKKKILFLARETRYGKCGGHDVVRENLNYFENDKMPGSVFWGRILRISYGIKNDGKIKYKFLPTAKAIAREMERTGDYGFAFMNISKYSNDNDDGSSADYVFMEKFLELSTSTMNNFIEKEILLLDPDIIITANIWNSKINANIDELFNWSREEIKSIKGKANLYFATSKRNGKKYQIIDLYHFSSRGLSNKEYFYDPVMKLLFG